MRRLKLELKQTMEMYSTACREALTAQQKVKSEEWFYFFDVLLRRMVLFFFNVLFQFQLVLPHYTFVCYSYWS